MSNNYWDQIDNAINHAANARAAVRTHAGKMGRFLVGNLEHCDKDTLKKLKKELANYNIHTGKWKEK